MIDEQRFPGRQGRLLFAYLVAEQGRAVPRDELAEALWTTPPATWDKVLTVTVSKLRSLLSEHGLDGASALTGAFGCYRLVLPDETLGGRDRRGGRGRRGRASARRGGLRAGQSRGRSRCVARPSAVPPR